MTVTFASVSLPHPLIKPGTKVQTNSARLTSGKMKYQTSTSTDPSWKVTCLCTSAERAAIIALIGTVGSLVIDGTTYTDCLIKSWDKDDEINPVTWQIGFTLVQDTS